MRCPNCNKFVSFGDPEATEEGAEVDQEAVVIAVRLVLPCSECGEELKEAMIDFSLPIDHECHGRSSEESVPEYEVKEVSITAYDRLLDTSLDGTPLPKNKRKIHYGAQISATIVCQTCNDEFDLGEIKDLPASEMEELV